MVLPIVAIGASAGGLEAISEFLVALPPKSAMAYVVIQHLDPDHPSLLPEILAKKTAMPVEQIHDGLGVQADRVYVMPPNSTLTLSEDRFCLTRRMSERPHHPVDVFFSSIADARRDAAVGVVLSGADSDGSIGVRQIKQAGGITFAQQPESARFQSMPQHAIETGCVDFVLRPGAIAQELVCLEKHPYLRQVSGPPGDSRQEGDSGDEADFKRVFRRLRSVHGVDFANSANEEIRSTNEELRNRNRELSVLNAELEKAQASADRARGFAEAIVNTVRDSLLVLDEQMHVVRANKAYYVNFNARPEDTEGRLFQHVAGGQLNTMELHERLAAALNSDAAVKAFEIPYSDLAAGPRVLRLNARKVPGDEHRANLILLAIEDVTLEKRHNKEAEMEAQERRDEVAHLLRVASVGELSSALAHELNQPLSAILYDAQAAQSFLGHGQFDLDEVRSILCDIVTNDQRASQVISRLRKLLKKSEFEPEKLEANDLIKEVLNLMNHELTARAVRVATELGAGLPSVLGDRVQLQQVLINLILKACDEMSQATEQARDADTPLTPRRQRRSDFGGGHRQWHSAG